MLLMTIIFGEFSISNLVVRRLVRAYMIITEGKP